ncbi:MAG: insulinase family protein [Deltaproteobacteria bacterium]|nr:MAG: insulinase family protein [Deltaproteobacteria bacterium]
MWTALSETPLSRRLSVRHFRLHNGLELLLLPDPSAPIVSYQTWYRVGSRDERPGKTGIAHLFEHLMFNQTESRGPGVLDREIEAVGGDTNASTWVDWTQYRISVPADRLDLAIDIESDRMQHLVLEPEPLEAEREVVINERLMRVEDDVDGFLDEQLMKRAFAGHPYGWPTIGWMEDIRAITLDDARAFYRTYYAPNNAVIVVAGDVDAAAALDAIERAYGDIAPAELPPRRRVPVAGRPGEVARFSKPVPADRAIAAYPVPPQSHPDWPIVDAIVALLTGGPSARLYERLVVDAQICTSVDGFVLPFAEASLLEVSFSLARGHTADEALTELDAAATALCDVPVPERELAKVKRWAETDFWAHLSTADGRAEALGHYHVTVGDYRALFRTVDEVRAINPADVQRVANRYFDSDRRTVVIAEPA